MVQITNVNIRMILIKKIRIGVQVFLILEHVLLEIVHSSTIMPEKVVQSLMTDY